MRRAGAVAICGAMTFACIHLIPLLPQFIAERRRTCAKCSGDDDALFHLCMALYPCLGHEIADDNSGTA
jgi:hypothetical protein